VAADLLDADEDARTEPLLDVSEDRQLAREQLANARLVEAQPPELGAPGSVVGEAGAQRLELAVDLGDGSLLEAESRDFVESQALLDEAVERAPTQLVVGLPRPARDQPERDRTLDVGGQDRVLVDHRHHPIDEAYRRGLGTRRAVRCETERDENRGEDGELLVAAGAHGAGAPRC
jgi:hypothetical protein